MSQSKCSPRVGAGSDIRSNESHQSSSDAFAVQSPLRSLQDFDRIEIDHAQIVRSWKSAVLGARERHLIQTDASEDAPAILAGDGSD